jgi:hypothetical protein
MATMGARSRDVTAVKGFAGNEDDELRRMLVDSEAKVGRLQAANQSLQVVQT